MTAENEQQPAAICRFCGLEIDVAGQRCPARDYGRCCR